MYTLYKQTTPIKDNDGNIVGYNTIPVQVADDFFILYGLKFDWKNKTVSRKGDTYYLDTLTSDDMQKIPSPEEWLATYGNRIKTIYYAEGEDLVNNPSDNPRNIKQRVYYNSQGIKKYDIRYSWDINDNITAESSIAPNKEGAVNYKLTIINADPNVEGSVLEMMYPEDTIISVSELKRELQSHITTWYIEGFKRNGKNLSDFSITENMEISANWYPKYIINSILLIMDGEPSGIAYNYPLGNAGHIYVIDAQKCLMQMRSFGFDAEYWRSNAYRGDRIICNGEEHESPWDVFLEDNISTKILCVKREFVLRIVDGEGSEIASGTATYDAITDLSALAPGYAGFSIGDDARSIDSNFQIGIDLLDKDNFPKYFDAETYTLTITAHSA